MMFINEKNYFVINLESFLEKIYLIHISMIIDQIMS